MKILLFKSLPFFQKKRKFFAGVLILLLAFAMFAGTAKNWSQSFKFVDEDEYISNAYLMREKGYRLYDSISTNHQPLPYIMSLFLQENYAARNLYETILSHRMFVWGWALLWSLILYFRFGNKVTFPILIFESIKYFTLGNQFVGESLVVYPLVYLAGSFFEFMVDDHFFKEDFFLGLVSGLIIFLLLPLIIPVALMGVLRYYFSKLGGLGEYVKGLTVVAFFVFFFVHPFDYLRETISHNIKYAIPVISEVGGVADFLKLFLLPITSILIKKTILSTWISLISLFWWTSLVVLVRKGKNKQILMWVVSFVLWGFVNSRNLSADQMYYAAFHLNPWMMVGLVWGWWWLRYVENRKLLVLSGFAASLIFLSPQMPWREKKSPLVDHQTGYTQVYEMGRVISLLSQNDNRLMVVPNEALLHMTASTELATRQITYYEWHYHVPELQTAFGDTLKSNLPEFVYFDESRSSYDIPLKSVLGEKYARMYNLSGNPTLLYLRADALDRIESKRLAGLEALGYEFLDL